MASSERRASTTSRTGHRRTDTSCSPRWPRRVGQSAKEHILQSRRFLRSWSPSEELADSALAPPPSTPTPAAAAGTLDMTLTFPGIKGQCDPIKTKPEQSPMIQSQGDTGLSADMKKHEIISGDNIITVETPVPEKAPCKDIISKEEENNKNPTPGEISAAAATTEQLAKSFVTKPFVRRALMGCTHDWGSPLPPYVSPTWESRKKPKDYLNDASAEVPDTPGSIEEIFRHITKSLKLASDPNLHAMPSPTKWNNSHIANLSKSEHHGEGLNVDTNKNNEEGCQVVEKAANEKVDDSKDGTDDDDADDDKVNDRDNGTDLDEDNRDTNNVLDGGNNEANDEKDDVRDIHDAQEKLSGNIEIEKPLAEKEIRFDEWESKSPTAVIAVSLNTAQPIRKEDNVAGSSTQNEINQPVQKIHIGTNTSNDSINNQCTKPHPTAASSPPSTSASTSPSAATSNSVLHKARNLTRSMLARIRSRSPTPTGVKTALENAIGTGRNFIHLSKKAVFTAACIPMGDPESSNGPCPSPSSPIFPLHEDIEMVDVAPSLKEETGKQKKKYAETECNFSEKTCAVSSEEIPLDFEGSCKNIPDDFSEYSQQPLFVPDNEKEAACPIIEMWEDSRIHTDKASTFKAFVSMDGVIETHFAVEDPLALSSLTKAVKEVINDTKSNEEEIKGCDTPDLKLTEPFESLSDIDELYENAFNFMRGNSFDNSKTDTLISSMVSPSKKDDANGIMRVSQSRVEVPLEDHCSEAEDLLRRTVSLVTSHEADPHDKDLTEVIALISEEVSLKRYPSMADLTDIENDIDHVESGSADVKGQSMVGNNSLGLTDVLSSRKESNDGIEKVYSDGDEDDYDDKNFENDEVVAYDACEEPILNMMEQSYDTDDDQGSSGWSSSDELIGGQGSGSSQKKSSLLRVTTPPNSPLAGMDKDKNQVSTMVSLFETKSILCQSKSSGEIIPSTPYTVGKGSALELLNLERNKDGAVTGDDHGKQFYIVKSQSAQHFEYRIDTDEILENNSMLPENEDEIYLSQTVRHEFLSKEEEGEDIGSTADEPSEELWDFHDVRNDEQDAEMALVDTLPSPPSFSLNECSEGDKQIPRRTRDHLEPSTSKDLWDDNQPVDAGKDAKIGAKNIAVQGTENAKDAEPDLQAGKVEEENVSKNTVSQCFCDSSESKTAEKLPGSDMFEDTEQFNDILHPDGEKEQEAFGELHTDKQELGNESPGNDKVNEEIISSSGKVECTQYGTDQKERKNQTGTGVSPLEIGDFVEEDRDMKSLESNGDFEENPKNRVSPVDAQIEILPDESTETRKHNKDLDSYTDAKNSTAVIKEEVPDSLENFETQSQNKLVKESDINEPVKEPIFSREEIHSECFSTDLIPSKTCTDSESAGTTAIVESLPSSICQSCQGEMHVDDLSYKPECCPRVGLFSGCPCFSKKQPVTDACPKKKLPSPILKGKNLDKDVLVSYTESSSPGLRSRGQVMWKLGTLQSCTQLRNNHSYRAMCVISDDDEDNDDDDDDNNDDEENEDNDEYGADFHDKCNSCSSKITESKVLSSPMSGQTLMQQFSLKNESCIDGKCMYDQTEQNFPRMTQPFPKPDARLFVESVVGGLTEDKIVGITRASQQELVAEVYPEMNSTGVFVAERKDIPLRQDGVDDNESHRRIEAYAGNKKRQCEDLEEEYYQHNKKPKPEFVFPQFSMSANVKCVSKGVSDTTQNIEGKVVGRRCALKRGSSFTTTPVKIRRTGDDVESQWRILHLKKRSKSSNSEPKGPVEVFEETQTLPSCDEFQNITKASVNRPKSITTRTHAKLCAVSTDHKTAGEDWSEITTKQNHISPCDYNKLQRYYFHGDVSHKNLNVTPSPECSEKIPNLEGGTRVVTIVSKPTRELKTKAASPTVYWSPPDPTTNQLTQSLPTHNATLQQVGSKIMFLERLRGKVEASISQVASTLDFVGRTQERIAKCDQILARSFQTLQRSSKISAMARDQIERVDRFLASERSSRSK